MTEVQRSASGGGVGSSDFCIRAELAQGRVHAAARIQLSERPLRRSGSKRSPPAARNHNGRKERTRSLAHEVGTARHVHRL